MKKNVLLLALLLGVFGFANANEISNNKTNSWETSRYGYMQPFKFMERGVAFFVFPNGEFDFNTRPNYRRSRRNNINISYGTPRSYSSTYYGNYNSNRGVRIEHDHLGRVRRVGNVFINYDRTGRIKRIGSVYMNYRRNLVTNIGGLHIFYNRHCRVIRTTGAIKHNLGCHFCGGNNCSINHYDSHDNNWNDDYYEDDNDWSNDDDMYYYRKGKTKKKRK